MILGMQYDFEKGRTFYIHFRIMILYRSAAGGSNSHRQPNLLQEVVCMVICYFFPSTYSNPFFPHVLSTSGGWTIL